MKAWVSWAMMLSVALVGCGTDQEAGSQEAGATGDVALQNVGGLDMAIRIQMDCVFDQASGKKTRVKVSRHYGGCALLDNVTVIPDEETGRSFRATYNDSSEGFVVQAHSISWGRGGPPAHQILLPAGALVSDQQERNYEAKLESQGAETALSGSCFLSSWKGSEAEVRQRCPAPTGG